MRRDEPEEIEVRLAGAVMADLLEGANANGAGRSHPAPSRKNQLPGAVHTASEMRTAFGISPSL
jgi:hypothetical protein